MKRIIEIAVLIVFFVQINFAQKTVPFPNDKVMKIGLLISDSGFIEAKRASQMAIDSANKNEGNSGFHFQLVVKSMEGLWGTGSKQAVDLIFEDNVWAILGSHDSKNAHLVEQVVAKMHTVFLSAWARDPTLAYANVPWFFNCVPNDHQQKVKMPTSENQFVKNYQQKYHQTPNDIAVFAFDGMNIIIKAIKNSNYNREKLQNSMSKIHFIGVTGSIQFDKYGSRMGSIGLTKFKNGIPVKVEN